jgi:hypothetical protein
MKERMKERKEERKEEKRKIIWPITNIWFAGVSIM